MHNFYTASDLKLSFNELAYIFIDNVYHTNVLRDNT